MLYAIADLHLDYTKKKSMEIFGDNWKNYEEKIFSNWQEKINEKDTVLIAGDICWAMKGEEAKIDLLRIDRLNGKKIVIKGNHDYWWQSYKKLLNLNLNTLNFLQNNSFEYEDYSICGVRGWVSEENGEDHDRKIFNRELLRLELSLKSAKCEKKIVMIHYPPFSSNGKFNELFNICAKYNVEKIVYGHLHGNGHKQIKEGFYKNIEISCVSGDYIDFNPVRLL